MNMVIAVETSKHPFNQDNYKLWYLELTKEGTVIGIGTITKDELVESVFNNYRKTGETGWRAFLKERDHSTPIEIYDFIARNIHENTHFGDLPTLAEFQETLNALHMGMELRSIA
jgi:hypothetical protein